MRNKLLLSTLAVPLLAIPGAKGATVFFDFRNGGVVGATETGAFDPGSVGDTATLPDGSGGTLTATLVEILAPEYIANPDSTGDSDAFIRTGLFVNGTTNISGQQALGVSNPTIGNTPFDLLGTTTNNGSESSDLNPDESFTFTFDQDVIFTEIEIESVVAADTIDILVDDVSVLTTNVEGFINGSALGALAGLTIEAGSEITFAVAGDDSVTSVRIESFTVDVVPEPSSIALLGLGSLMMLKRRRS